MQRTLFLLCLSFIFLSCKKNVVEVEGDSFRISILPVKTEAFNQFKITGTLDVRKASGNIEYGLLVGKSINPTLENATKYKLGGSQVSADFIHQLIGLDTGAVFYVRAYGLADKIVEYSANQIIGKISPQIYTQESTLNYSRTFTIITNLEQINPAHPVKAFLNNTQIELKSAVKSNVGMVFTAEFNDQLSPGDYTLKLSVNNLDIIYQKKLPLLEGTWMQVEDLPPDNNSIYAPSDRFISGDWVYTYKIVSGTNKVEFDKYNFKTAEKISLTPLNNLYRLESPAIVQQGAFIHFIGGNQIGDTPNGISKKSYYVYNTISDSWVKEADFPAGARKSAISTLVNNKLYVGLGYNQGIVNISTNIYYNDLWSYDLITKEWTKMADFPSSDGRVFGASFTIGSKLYMTCGAVAKNGVASQAATKELWCYDTTTNQWTKKANYPGKGEILFANFSIGNYGYVGMGETATYDSYYGKKIDRQFFKYDPNADRWTEVSNFNFNPGISKAVSGSNGVIGIVGGGTDQNSTATNSLYIFVPAK